MTPCRRELDLQLAAHARRAAGDDRELPSNESTWTPFAPHRCNPTPRWSIRNGSTRSAGRSQVHKSPACRHGGGHAAVMEPGEFEGTIGCYHWESEPWWPPDPRRRRAPNVLIVVLDDVGFAQLGCFGSDIETPHLDGLAANGLALPRASTPRPCARRRGHAC